MSVRYETSELPQDDRGRRRWGIYDTKTRELVEDEGELLVFYAERTDRGAEGWIARQTSLDKAGVGRA